MNNIPYIEIFLPGRAVGKARPRFSKGKIYTADRYGDWKKEAIAHIKSLNLPTAPKPCAIECYFINFLSSDADNLQGSVLDALVQAGCLENDSSSFVVSSSGIFASQKKLRGKDKVVGVLIRIKDSEVLQLNPL